MVKPFIRIADAAGDTAAVLYARLWEVKAADNTVRLSAAGLSKLAGLKRWMLFSQLRKLENIGALSRLRRFRASVITLQEPHKLIVNGGDELLPRGNARCDRRTKKTRPNVGNKLVGNLNGDVGVDQRSPHQAKRIGRVALGKRSRATDGAEGSTHRLGKPFKHGAKSTPTGPDSPRFDRHGYDRSGKWTNEQVDRIVAAYPAFMGGRQPVRKATIDCLDAMKVHHQGKHLPIGIVNILEREARDVADWTRIPAPAKFFTDFAARLREGKGGGA